MTLNTDGPMHRSVVVEEKVGKRPRSNHTEIDGSDLDQLRPLTSLASTLQHDPAFTYEKQTVYT